MVAMKNVIRDALDKVLKVHINDLDLKPKINTRNSMQTRTIDTKPQYYSTSKYNDLVLGYVSRIVSSASLANVTLKKNGRRVNNEFSLKLQHRIARDATFGSFIKEMLTARLLESESFALIVWRKVDDTKVRTMDDFVKVVPISRDMVEVGINPLTDEVYYEINVPGEENTIKWSYEVIHLKNLTINGYDGIDLFKEVKNTLELSETLDRSIKRKLDDDTPPYAIANLKDIPTDLNDIERNVVYGDIKKVMEDNNLTDDDLDDMVDWDKVNTFRTYESNLRGVSEANKKRSLLIYDKQYMEIEPVNNDPHLFDPGYVEKVVKQRIESYLNLPVGFTNLEIGTTGYKDIRGEYMQYTIVPLLKEIEDELNRKLLTKDELLDGYTISVEVELKYLLTPSEIEEIAFKSSRSPYRSPNELREMLGEEPYDDPVFDKPWPALDVQPYDQRGLEQEKDVQNSEKTSESGDG